MTETPAHMELHCRSHYSLLDGASSPSALLSRAAELDMPALALTDHDAVYGMVPFATEALYRGIHPILGAELTLCVFDESQVAGERPLASFLERLSDDKQDLFDTLCRVIAATGVTVEVQRLAPGVHGVSQGGTVIISSAWDNRNRINLLLHEWAHKILPCEWISNEERQQLPRRVKECQAEATAYIVAQYLGLQNTFSSDYLHMYGVTSQLLIDNFDQVQRASHYMMRPLKAGDKMESILSSLK